MKLRIDRIPEKKNVEKPGLVQLVPSSSNGNMSAYGNAIKVGAKAAREKEDSRGRRKYFHKILRDDERATIRLPIRWIHRNFKTFLVCSLSIRLPNTIFHKKAQGALIGAGS